MARVFLAIDLPLSLKKELSKLRKGSSSTPSEQKSGIHDNSEGQNFGRIKWVEEENLHLTLFFFGHVAERELERIVSVCEKGVKGFSPFEVYLTEISGFPKGGDFRVLFFGCEERSSTLQRIVKELARDFKKKGLKVEEKEFHPHITLFRLKELIDPLAYRSYIKDLMRRADNLRGKSFLVKEIVLFESKLSPAGPKYSPIKIFPLGGE